MSQMTHRVFGCPLSVRMQKEDLSQRHRRALHASLTSSCPPGSIRRRALRRLDTAAAVASAAAGNDRRGQRRRRTRSPPSAAADLSKPWRTLSSDKPMVCATCKPAFCSFIRFYRTEIEKTRCWQQLSQNGRSKHQCTRVAKLTGGVFESAANILRPLVLCCLLNY